MSTPNRNSPKGLSLGLKPNARFALLVDPQRQPKQVDTPFSGDIVSGKNTYVYDAHTYHTKVPPEGIEKLIAYYTQPDDVVLDPFCGSGMTGVAATQKGRKALLCDLSPAATFIARNLNTPVDAGDYLRAAYTLLDDSTGLERSLYNTRCRRCGEFVALLYMVWSYGVICPHCDDEFILWDVARDERQRVRESKILSEFTCPACKIPMKKRGLKRTKRYPVQVGYQCCTSGPKETAVPLDDWDRAQLECSERESIPAHLWYPTAVFPPGINTRQPVAAGITTIDKAYTPRALYAMAHLWDAASQFPDERMRDKLLFTLTSLYQRVTVFSEFRFWGGSSNTANYNVPFIMNEQNVFRTFARKARTISWYFKTAPRVPREVEVSTQSACHLTQIPDKAVDYIFTDPPFGGNINYSEMNFLWESWLGVCTDTTEEAIINSVQGKGVQEYRSLLCAAFGECRRVLKDGAWLTVVFHNSSDVVWKALQGALVDAGFRLEGTQTFDKEHGTFKQFVSDNAVGYDLVLHCRKAEAARNFRVRSKEELAADAIEFIQTRLAKDGERYLFHYLHVERAPEIDYRKLYAEWLASTLPETLVSLSFEEFRATVEKAVPKLHLQPKQLTLL
ncbi:MAG: DNA methyltransferase [Candidatus Binatia bacterium]